MRSRGFIQEEYEALAKDMAAKQAKSAPGGESTPLSQGKVEGCMKKKNRKHGILGSKWNKRWFVLENGILTYAKNRQEIVKGEIQVFSMHELEYVNQRKERLEFELKFPERVLHLQTLCKDDLKKWLAAFESAKRVGPIRANQHSPTSPLDVDCADLPGYRSHSQKSSLRDCKSAGGTSSAKKDVSPRSLLANPANGRRCFGNYFDDFETDMQSSGYVTNLEAQRLGRNQDTKIEEFSLGGCESPVPMLAGVETPAQQQQQRDLNFDFAKPFGGLSMDENSDEGWLEEDWDDEDNDKDEKSRQGGEKSTTPVVFLSSPKVGSASKSGTISSKDGLLECDMKAVKYDSQITLPDIEPASPGDSHHPMDFCGGKEVNVLDDINPDEDWLNDEWDSE
ncbi:PH domain-containing protein [Chloropicon primus]|uniref:PH domain-containing protein n=1 Tax=Chloropicon primus TaxID=1764295 RepID=A0A5B8MS56_9CHLO|nr:hypothetical protein A3770_10p59470 [Chloropicon primus]UPR02641.1 PH domain-containing protein [Chloropicon primus]|eukprot:QDZ23429.1 hypothetical protein A3770_10p59470 [Chloropicon primus]